MSTATKRARYGAFRKWLANLTPVVVRRCSCGKRAWWENKAGADRVGCSSCGETFTHA